MTELDERKAAILRAIVEQYVDTAQPVGSQTVTQHGRARRLGRHRAQRDVGARAGRLHRPAAHRRRAGSRPTAATATTSTTSRAPAQLPAAERRRIVEFFTQRHAGDGRPAARDEPAARAGHRARGGRRRARSRESVVVRSAHLVLLQPRVLLAVVVLSNGAVEKEIVVLDDDADPTTTSPTPSARLAAAPRRPPARRAPAPTTCRRRAPAIAADALVARVVRRARARTSSCTTSEPLYVGGASRLAAEHDAFVDARAPPRLLELLEQHVVLASLIRELLGPGPHRAHRLRERARRSARVLARARAVPRRGRAGRHGRRARPDAHGLPQGAGRGRRPCRTSSDGSSRDDRPMTR